MQFGCFDDLLSNVGVPCRKAMDDVAGFHNRKPGTRSIVRNTGVAAEFREIDFLSRAPCAKFQKSGEGLEVAHINYLAHVSL